MSSEVVAALISGLVGVILGGALTYSIESKKITAEGFSRPSNYLYEKRAELCEQMIIASDQALPTIWEIWALTSPQEKMSDQEVNAAVKTIVSKDITLKELERILTLCKIYGSASLVEACGQFVGQYRELMREPDHLKALVGIDQAEPLLKAIRLEIGTDVLSEHLIDQLHLKRETPMESPEAK